MSFQAGIMDPIDFENHCHHFGPPHWPFNSSNSHRPCCNKALLGFLVSFATSAVIMRSHLEESMKQLTLILTLSLFFTMAQADDHNPRQQAFKECAQKANFIKGEKPSKESKTQFKQCLVEKGVKKTQRKNRSPEHKVAFKACHQELGIDKKEKPRRKLDDDTKAKLRECLVAKGVKKTKRK